MPYMYIRIASKINLVIGEYSGPDKDSTRITIKTAPNPNIDQYCSLFISYQFILTGVLPSRFITYGP